MPDCCGTFGAYVTGKCQRQLPDCQRQGDKLIFGAFLALSLKGREVPKLKSAGVMQALGVVDSVLSQIKFPDAIDADNRLSLTCFNVLDNIFKACSDPQQLDMLREDIVGALGPAILCCCTKKRHMMGRTDCWFVTQEALLGLLETCLHTVSHDDSRGLRLIKSIDPYVTDKLMELLVFNLTVDPKLFLQVKSLLFTMKSRKGPSSVLPSSKVHALVVLTLFLQFSDRVDDGGEAMVKKVGRLIVPFGAPGGLTGRHFAECFLDWAAHMGLAEYCMNSTYMGVELLQCLVKLYFRFGICKGLSDLVDGFDKEFIGLKSDSALKDWAKARLKK